MRGTALVVGGGIGGLAAALGIRQAGWDVTVLERVPVVKEVGAGLALWANGLRALDRVGVGDAVRAVARRHDGGAIRNAAGDVLMRLDSDEGATDAAWLGSMVHRAELLSALFRAVGADAVRTGTEVLRVSEQGDQVAAFLADGTAMEADLLIGADGIRSAVRRSLFGEVPLRYAGYTVWRWVAEFPAARALTGETWGAGARFGQAALPDGRVYVYATHDSPPDLRGAGGELPELRRLFAGWHAPIPELVEAASEADVLRNDCFDIRPLPSWGQGRVTLLGDAAHAMTPNLGQGACQALEDAAVLRRWLSMEPDPQRALRGYQRERRPRATRFQSRSWSAGALGQWSDPLAVRLRETLARRVLPRLQRAQMRELAQVQF